MDDRDRAGTLKRPQDWTFVATTVLENNTIVTENKSIITENNLDTEDCILKTKKLYILYVLLMRSSTTVLLFSGILQRTLVFLVPGQCPLKPVWSAPESSPIALSILLSHISRHMSSVTTTK